MTEFQQFVWDHRNDDVLRLSLSGSKYPGIALSAAVRQIEAFQKIKTKIPSWYCPGMEFPVSLSVEQASSEATAKFKSTLMDAGTVLDLTLGLGVDAAFWAEHAARVSAVEMNADILAAARHNFDVLGYRNISLHHTDAESFLKSTAGRFDLVYLDPARRDHKQSKVFRLSECSPDILKIKDLIFSKSDRILIKTAPFLDIKQAIEQLGQVTSVWILETGGDCREVLYLLEKRAQPGSCTTIHALNLAADGKPISCFSFNPDDEAALDITYSPPLSYLYEPGPAIMKSGGFKSFATAFGLKKIHLHTHLYTSAVLIDPVPGRSFAVQFVCRYDKKEVAQLLPGDKANVSVRNFPEGAVDVRKKLGLKDGGDWYLYALTGPDEKKYIAGCRKV